MYWRKLTKLSADRIRLDENHAFQSGDYLVDIAEIMAELKHEGYTFLRLSKTMYDTYGDKIIYPEDLINWAAISRMFINDRNGIRKNKVPVKHKENINKLLFLIEAWMKETGI